MMKALIADAAIELAPSSRHADGRSSRYDTAASRLIITLIVARMEAATRRGMSSLKGF